jgi:hypothetical protein
MIARRPLILVLFLAGTAYGAELLVGEAQRHDDGTASVVIALRPDTGDAVGALQFDVEYDTAAWTFETVATGDAAKAAEKTASFNEFARGNVRVILAGLNRNAIPAGPIAVVHFASATANAGIQIQRVILSDPFGVEVPVRVLAADHATASAHETAPAASYMELILAWSFAATAFLGIAFAARQLLFAGPRRSRR